LSKRILVIDDEEMIRRSFVIALKDMPYQIDTVESGEKGIEKIKTNKYDLIFLDLKMAGIDGVETLIEIRKTDKDVPVYIVTSFHKEFFYQLKGAKEQNIHFELVSKPLKAEKIVLITKSVLEKPQHIQNNELSRE